MSGTPGNDDLPHEFIQLARDLQHRDSLPPEEYEALKGTYTAIATNIGSDSCHFVLGSYEEGRRHRLTETVQAIESFPGNHRAYLLEDFPDELDPIFQFQLIAEYSDSIIAICEHDRGGLQVELGMAVTKYFDKCHILKKVYGTEKEREIYNFMLICGVFETFSREGRLWAWEDGAEFRTQRHNLLSSIL